MSYRVSGFPGHHVEQRLGSDAASRTGESKQGGGERQMAFGGGIAGERAELSLLSLLRRHLGSLALLMLTGIGVGLATIALSKPSYTATSALFIDPRSRKVVTDDVVSGAIGNDVSLFESQLAIIRSDAILRRVIVAESLLTDPVFTAKSTRPGFLSRLREQLVGPTINVDEMTEALSTLAKALRVRREMNTYIVSVDAISVDPVSASRLANAVVQAYIDDQATAKSDGASKANSLIDSRLDELKQQVRRAETRMDEFKRANKIVTSEGGLLNEQQLTRLNTELVSVRTQLATTKARLDELNNTLKRGVSPESLPDAMTSGVIQKLRDQFAAAARREASLSAQLQARHPVLVDARAQLTSVRQQILAELQRITAATKSEYQIAANREREIAAVLNTAENEVAKTNSAQIELRAYEREADAGREVLRAFLARAKETQEQQNMSIAEARVITPAVVPSRPTSPNPPLILLVSALSGLGLGVARAAWMNARQHQTSGYATPARSSSAANVRAPRIMPETAPSIEPLPLLGSIAELPQRPAHANPLRSLVRGATTQPIAIGAVLNAIADETMPGEAPFRTSVRDALAALRRAAPDTLPQIALVTSARPTTGVTIVATALAYTAARDGVKTLLVDASSADPALSLLFATAKEQNEPCVLDSKRHLQAIVETDTRSGLALLPIALADLRTFSADQNRRFAKGLTELAADYNLVIIDSGAVTFTLAERSLAALANQIIVVSRPGEETGTATLRWLEDHGINAGNGRRLLTMGKPDVAPMAKT